MFPLILDKNRKEWESIKLSSYPLFCLLSENNPVDSLISLLTSSSIGYCGVTPVITRYSWPSRESGPNGESFILIDLPLELTCECFFLVFPLLIFPFNVASIRTFFAARISLNRSIDLDRHIISADGYADQCIFITSRFNAVDWALTTSQVEGDDQFMSSCFEWAGWKMQITTIFRRGNRCN